MSSLSELIARVENASGQSRELDALIECEVRRLQAYAVGLSDETRAHWNPIGSKGEVIDNQGLCRYHSPAYTSSIDTALTLMPEGWGWSVGDVHGSSEDYNGAGMPWAEIWKRGFKPARIPSMAWTVEGRNILNAAAPALALVAACLKARLLDAASSEARG